MNEEIQEEVSGGDDNLKQENNEVLPATETDTDTGKKEVVLKKKRSPWNTLLNVIIIVFAVILIGELVFGIFYSGIYVGGDSMMDTIIGAPTIGTTADGKKELGKGGDYIYINKYKTPEYFDIVVVWDEAKGENIIKRVVAFGGDTVEIIDGDLYVNDEKVSEPYVVHNDFQNYLDKSVYNVQKHTVAENCLFLLGDNRNVSADSRNPRNGTNNGAYDISFLRGVVPDWAMNLKGAITAVYTFFHFTLFNKG